MSSGSGENGQTDGTGRLLAGRYRVTAQLGRGGMGVVWRAVDEVLGREVAVKELRTYNDADGPELAGLRVRMKREARAAARVRHPGVVAVHDVTEIDGRPVIVMELVDGPSLDSVLRERGTLEPREAAGIGAKVMDALAAAHRAGVLHRDVKPGNILLDRSGRVVLTDFGIATMEDPGDDAATHLTRSGQLVGSLDYLAPERAQGADFGPASDVWALGATLYAAVEGSSPFRRTSTFSTLTAIVTEPLPDARRAGALGPVLQRLLDKRPEGRPEAEEARELLRAVAESSGTDVPTTALRGPGDGVPARARQEREAGPVPPGMGPVTPDPTGTPGQGTPQPPGSGAPQQGTAGPQPPEAREAGTPGQGAPGQDASTAQNFNAPGQSAPGPQGFPAPGQGTPGQGASGYGAPAQGVPGPQGFSAPGQGVPGQGTPGQGASGYGTPAQGVPGPQGFSTPGHGTPGHGTSGQGTPGPGTPGFQDPTVHEQGYGAPGQIGRPGPGFGSSAPVPQDPAVTGPMTTPGPDRRKGRALLAAVAVTVVLASAGVTVALLNDNGDPGAEARPAPSGVAAHVSGPASATPDADRSDKAKPTGKGDDKTPAATRTPSRDAESTPTDGAATPTPPKASGGGGTSGGTSGGGTSGGGSGGGGTTGGAGTTGGGGGSTPAPACSAIGGGKYNCQVWKTAKSYTASGAEAGILNAGTNYFYCQQNLGRRETDGEWTNVWWAKTDDDSGNTGVFVSDVYIKGGDNDEPVPGLPVC